MKYFWKDIIFTLVALTACWFIGGWPGLISGAILGVLEVSLSFDNAVVNASVLKDMNEVWRKRFLTWGILIAVVGMRLVFPILIVAGTAALNPIDVVSMAIHSPQTYAQHLSASHIQVAGFGGAFLFMIFFNFFLDRKKDSHWLSWLEKPLAWFGRFEGVQAVATLIVSAIFSLFIDSAHMTVFLLASVVGIVAHFAVDWLGDLLSGEVEEDSGATKAVKTGLAGFLFLETQDAAFSFDGVVGAFSVSNEIFIIMLGLGIGAMAIRSLTLLMVEKGTLDALPYLEHSAFWAIGALSTMMYVSTFQEIPEVVTGLIGAGIIGLGVAHSLLKNQKEASMILH